MSKDIQQIQEKILPILKRAGVLRSSTFGFNTEADVELEKQFSNLSNKYGLKFIILHGSYATGKQHKNSDLDIAIVAKQELEFKEYLNLYGEMDEILNLPEETDLDFKALNKVDPLFRYEVTRDGKLLYGNKSEYEDFKAFAFNAYIDARPLFDLEQQLVRKYQVHLNSLYA